MAPASVERAAARSPGIVQALALLLPITMAVMGSVVLQPVQGLLAGHFADVPGNTYWVPFLLTVPAIAAALFTIPAGYIADVFGRRPVLIVGIAIYVVVGVLPWFLQSLLPIALSRIGVGLCEGVVLTVTTALLGDYFKGRKRDRLLGWQAAIASTSASLLIPLSGFLGSRLGWNGPFLIYSIALVWLVGIITLTWEPEPDASAGEHSGSVSWTGFPWKRVISICLITVLGAYFFYTVQFEIPTVLPSFGITDPADIGTRMGLVSWGMVAGAVLFQIFIKRGTSMLLLAELTVVAATFIAMRYVGSSNALVATAFLNQVGCGAILPTLLTASMRFLPFEHRGRGTGIWQGTLASGQFVVGMSFPALASACGGDRLQALFIIGLVAAVAAVITLVVIATGHGRSEPEAEHPV